ncbi:MAG: hypothetical protein NWR72_05765, partial [Bacteroidia bacterium]|nr:hypothetical protein [Bacteroidia bacterium]
MNRFNKWLMRAGMLAAIALMTTPHTYGQSCLVFEREMETLFLNHQAKTPVPRQDLEQIRSRCPEPSRKMLLIYNFFRAVDAYQSPDLSDRESYDRAVAYYNRAAEHFMLLSDLDLK